MPEVLHVRTHERNDMDAKQLISSAARRVAIESVGTDDSFLVNRIAACTEDRFAWVEGLIEAAQKRIDNCPNCAGMPAPCARCEPMVAALAAIPRGENE